MASIKKIGTELNWDIEKKAIYGNYSGFEITLEQNLSYSNSHNNFKILYIPYNNISSSDAGALSDFINLNKKDLKAINYEVKQNILTIRLNEGIKGINAERLKEVLDKYITKFSQLGITPRKTCIYCNDESTDSTVYINKVKLPSHESCKQAAIAKANEQKEILNEQPGSILGYIGGLVGAILGAIPYAVAVWFGWYIGIITILAGILSYYGFNLLGGRPKRYTKYIISLFTFGAIILSNVGIMFYIALDNDATIQQVWNHPELKGIFTESFGMSALFGLIGVFFVYSRIKNDEKQIEIL